MECNVPRALNKAYAKMMGYFWLPCPRCGRMFGGHEIGMGRIPTGTPGIYKVCCKFCDKP